MVACGPRWINWRWHGVPLFRRSGKAMGASRRSSSSASSRRRCGCSPRIRTHAVRPENEIEIDSADPGAIKTYFLAKVPGAELSLGNAEMAFYYKNSFAASHALEGYEHLILLAMVGDQSLFTSADGIERVWEISEPLLKNPPPVEPYPVGSYGPESSRS